MSQKALDNAADYAKIQAGLPSINCTCGKLVGRGIGVFELPCRHKNNHDGRNVKVFGQAGRAGVRIFRVEVM